MIAQTSPSVPNMLLLDISSLTQQAKQEVLDFYQFLLLHVSLSFTITAF
ncbi:hypothetical protein U14_03647 [Candidatus Moduliflexus flocculans]|uniref:Uncharacterized protein n=1 Tax=Candidatus Moduliflexus flocculans TaxID=1499966 RepID=A0A081BPT0_9BACT|nr:hypothetical protein U14_03647 [Candidatus Moduliflexus flocculans]